MSYYYITITVYVYHTHLWNNSVSLWTLCYIEAITLRLLCVQDSVLRVSIIASPLIISNCEASEACLQFGFGVIRQSPNSGVVVYGRVYEAHHIV